MKVVFRIFRVALMFFSRIPVGTIENFQEEDLNKATKFFPWVGYIIAGMQAIVFVAFTYVFPVDISVVFSMIFSVLLTGAFHEDGLADVCDGFGGAFSKERKLEIMKDSRLGTYGAVGIWFLFTLKFILLCKFNVMLTPLCIILSGVLGRLLSVSLIRFSTYSRVDASSKSKPLGTKMTVSEYLFALFSVVPFLFIPTIQRSLFYLLPILAISYFFFHWWGKKQIDGFTGDYLGFTEQCGEIIVLLTLFQVLL